MVNTDKKKVALPQAAAVLRDSHGINTNYRTLYRLVCDGKLRAERTAGGRYIVDTAEAAEVASSTIA